MSRRQDSSIRNLSQLRVLLPCQNLMQMTEGLLFRDDCHVKLLRIGNQLLRIVCGNRSAGKRRERSRGVLHCVLEIRRVDIQLVRGEGANLFFLKLQRGQRPARQIVMHAAPAHGRPVANRRAGENRNCRGTPNQLFQSLCSTKDSGGGVPDDEDIPLFRHQHVAFRLHGDVEGHVLTLEHLACKRSVVPQQVNAHGGCGLP